jgi:hypothetical protein
VSADFPSETRSGVDKGTTQVATFPASIDARFIDRINISGPVGSTCLLYIGQISNMGFRDGSASGNQDVAEYPNGLYVPSGSTVYLEWNIDSPLATATIQWRKASGL